MSQGQNTELIATFGLELLRLVARINTAARANGTEVETLLREAERHNATTIYDIIEEGDSHGR